MATQAEELPMVAGEVVVLGVDTVAQVEDTLVFQVGVVIMVAARALVGVQVVDRDIREAQVMENLYFLVVDVQPVVAVQVDRTVIRQLQHKHPHHPEVVHGKKTGIF